MARPVDQRQFGLRGGAPQYENQMFPLFIQTGNDCIGEIFPAVFPVRASLMRADGQHGIQQQDALLRPADQRTGFRHRQIQVCIQFLEDVAQRRRKTDAVPHRKSQPVRLSVVMIRILSQNNHSGLVGRRQPESCEKLLRRGKNSLGAVFISQKPGEGAEGVRLNCITQKIAPVIRQTAGQVKR